jgi:hypothetical protein
MRKMIANMWIALALGATMMVGGVATVAAFDDDKGNGDCLRDCLKDGSCEDSTCDALGEGSADGVCDSCNEYLYDRDFLYEEPGPHQSACGQE